MHYHRYEPTPYSGLDELLNQYEIRSSDRIVDFGCGKGRLNFYMHHKCGALAVGIEMNEEFYKERWIIEIVMHERHETVRENSIPMLFSAGI